MKKLFGKENEKENENVMENVAFDGNDSSEQGINGKKIALIAGIVAAVLLVIYVGFAIYFQSHFFFRSTVNGVSASGKSPAAVENAISSTADQYELTIIAEDGKEEVIPQADVDMTIAFDGQIEKMLEGQNGFAWPGALIHPKEYVSEEVVDCDKNKVKQAVEKLDCVTSKNQTPTEDATFTYKNGEFIIVDEVYGTQMDAEAFADKVFDAMTSLQSTLDLKEDKCYVQPKVTADDKALKNLVKDLNKCVNTKITYQVGDATEAVSKDEIAKWLSADKKQKVAFNQEAMEAFVSTMAKKYNTYGQSKQLATSYGATVTVPGGNYGWKIDNEKEVAQLKKEIKAQKDVKRDFEYAVKANSRGTNDYGDSYVEINLTAQHLYLYKNGSLILDTDFVSGNVSKGNGSPTGAYKITYTEKNATLRGANYTTPVSFWMPFAGNVGMHDATWRSTFGGSIYKTSGSHGCINLPYSAAQTIFNNVSTGYAVLVYTLPGTESTKGIAMDAATPVKDIINSIGEVTLNSEGVIADARAQYDALSDEAKGYVTNYDVLAAAEARLAQLKAEADAAAQQQAAADAAAAQQKNDQNAANAVIKQINDIGTVVKNDEACNAKIQGAQNAYNALTDTQKALVTNKAVLDKAIADYNN